MIASVELVIFSFGASLGLGIVFGIERKYLIFAGLGGALTRVVYLFLYAFTSQTFFISFFAAMAAALYAEFMAVRTKRPSVVFLYPSIIPLIPGSLLYYSVVGVIIRDSQMVSENAFKCIYSLLGLGIGFAVVSMVMYYQRNYLHVKQLKNIAKVFPGSGKKSE